MSFLFEEKDHLSSASGQHPDQGISNPATDS